MKPPHMTGDMLGEGTSAVVHAAKIDGENWVAVKIFKDKYKDTAQFEIAVLRKLEHPHLSALLPSPVQDSAQKLYPGSVVIALELCEPVKRHMKISRCLGRWIVELASAVEHMHSRGVMHNDLKPENVFIATDECLKLGDLGLAGDSPSLSQSCQSSPYAPPEASVCGRLVSYPADAWAFVVTAIEMTSNTYVFPNCERGSELEYIVSEPIRAPGAFFGRIAAPNCLKEIASLVFRPEHERPSMAEVAAFLSAKLGALGLDRNVFVQM